MRGFDFTQRRFAALPEAQQHKKCAELLRIAYSLGDGADEALLAYAPLAAWLGCSPITNPSAQTIADRYHFHARIAHMGHKEHHLLPSVRQNDRAFASPLLPIAIYLDNIRSAHNVGSILRTVEAFSLGEVYFGGSTPYATHKQVIDTSMGTTEWVACHPAPSLDALPRPLIALETVDGAASLFDYPFPASFTLAVGNEEYGCSEELLKAADAIIEIPLRGRKNSLNVANAFAIAAAEITKALSKNSPAL